MNSDTIVKYIAYVLVMVCIAVRNLVEKRETHDLLTNFVLYVLTMYLFLVV